MDATLRRLASLCKENEKRYYMKDSDTPTVFGHLLFLKGIFGNNDDNDITWETVIALANREWPGQINTMDDLSDFLEPLKFRTRELGTVVPYYPWMCGAQKADGRPCRNKKYNDECEQRNKRCLIQLARINGNSRTAWLIPYYYELPEKGDIPVDTTLQQAYACTYSGQYFKISEKDRIQINSRKVYIHISELNIDIPILNFAFRTPSLNLAQYYFTDRDLDLPPGVQLSYRKSL